MLLSLKQFERRFPNDLACQAYLERLRWPQGVGCPRPQCYPTEPPWRPSRGRRLICRKCRAQFSPTSGTLLDGLHTPLKVVFLSAWWLTVGIHLSTIELQQRLGLPHYRVAQSLRLRWRLAMLEDLGIDLSEFELAGRIGTPGGIEQRFRDIHQEVLPGVQTYSTGSKEAFDLLLRCSLRLKPIKEIDLRRFFRGEVAIHREGEPNSL
ncbi:transposase [Geothrix terrae]|uniref:transposase n=1 Tax=Geothrix terrae TaxID=2922720 RepID=UPI003B848FC0